MKELRGALAGKAPLAWKYIACKYMFHLFAFVYPVVGAVGARIGPGFCFGHPGDKVWLVHFVCCAASPFITSFLHPYSKCGAWLGVEIRS